MEGHRYCEPGVNEPDQHNPNLWRFHYPYNVAKDDTVDGPLQKALDKVTAGADINAKFKTYNDFQNALSTPSRLAIPTPRASKILSGAALATG